MPDLLVRHLRLRIVRAGSLFWGSDPRALARLAIAALPRLLAEELDALGIGEEAAVELPDPVQVRLRGTPAGIAAALDPTEPAAGARSAVREALAEALASVPRAAGPRLDRLRPHDENAALPRPALNDLLRLYASGELPARLRGMDPGLLRAYHRLLLIESGPTTTRPPRAASAAELDEAERFVSALAAGFAHWRKPGLSEERTRERILAAVALAARVGVVPFDPGVRSLIERLLPWEDLAVEGPEPARPPVSPATIARGPAPESPAQTAPEAERSPRDASADLTLDQSAPILPLLAACLLARTGALTRVAHHLDELGRGQDLPLWIAGLAFKLGPAPARGWMYTRETWESVAAIADYPLLSGEGLVHVADHPGAGWPELTAELLEVDHEIDIDPLLASRPACALSRRPHFDQHMSRVAGWTLERIGFALWPEGRPLIQATLERLDSLEVRLRRGREGVSVRVPLGQRHSDLLRAGLLADVPSAPWLRDGDPIRFCGG